MVTSKEPDGDHERESRGPVVGKRRNASIAISVKNVGDEGLVDFTTFSRTSLIAHLIAEEVKIFAIC